MILLVLICSTSVVRYPFFKLRCNSFLLTRPLLATLGTIIATEFLLSLSSVAVVTLESVKITLTKKI